MKEELGQNLRAEVQSIDNRLSKVVHDVDTLVVIQRFYSLLAGMRLVAALTSCFLHSCRRCAWCSTVTTRLTECNTAILEQDGQLSALTARFLDQREETQWQIQSAAAEAEACVISPICCCPRTFFLCADTSAVCASTGQWCGLPVLHRPLDWLYRRDQPTRGG